MARVDILLATFNGARFLPTQPASLAAQDHHDRRLIVPDDGSTDGSVGLVETWAETVPREVRLPPYGDGGGKSDGGDARSGDPLSTFNNHRQSAILSPLFPATREPGQGAGRR